MKSLPQNPDVIVVGAGTAGLSAAKTLIDAGLVVAVLEADQHVGGRCITDTNVFELPFDRGGSWLHSAEINPLADIALDNGRSLHKKRWYWEKTFINNRLLDEQEISDYGRYNYGMWDIINEIGAENTEISIDNALPESRWKETAKHWVPQMLGGDSDVTSAADSSRYSDTEGDWLVSGGLGALIASMHSDVGVELDCPVTSIDYSGDGVTAATPKGTLRAKYLVVTVSTGVLAAEKIKFTPSLPDEKLNAISQLPNGLLNKIGLDFDPAWKEVHEGYMADYHKQGEEFCSYLFGFYDTSLAVGFVAGRFADMLEKEGDGAATDFCLQGLKTLFGNDVMKYVRGTTETAWRSNPNTIGAYSYALPGCADARKTLAQSINDCIFFAGEATMPNAFATVHGAYLSGKDVAQQIIDMHG